jgi:hypothetical protein
LPVHHRTAIVASAYMSLISSTASFLSSIFPQQHLSSSRPFLIISPPLPHPPPAVLLPPAYSASGPSSGASVIPSTTVDGSFPLRLWWYSFIPNRCSRWSFSALNALIAANCRFLVSYGH